MLVLRDGYARRFFSAPAAVVFYAADAAICALFMIIMSPLSPFYALPTPMPHRQPRRYC